MPALPKTVSDLELARDTTQVLNEIRLLDDPILVIRSDQIAAVLLSSSSYEELTAAADYVPSRKPRPVDEVGPTAKDIVDLSSYPTLEEIEREVILDRLSKTSGNRTQAAGTLGIGLRTLQRKIREYQESGFDVP